MQNASEETIWTDSGEAKCNLLRDALHHPLL